MGMIASAPGSPSAAAVRNRPGGQALVDMIRHAGLTDAVRDGALAAAGERFDAAKTALRSTPAWTAWAAAKASLTAVQRQLADLRARIAVMQPDPLANLDELAGATAKLVIVEAEVKRMYAALPPLWKAVDVAWRPVFAGTRRQLLTESQADYCRLAAAAWPKIVAALSDLAPIFWMMWLSDDVRGDGFDCGRFERLAQE